MTTRCLHKATHNQASSLTTQNQAKSLLRLSKTRQLLFYFTLLIRQTLEVFNITTLKRSTGISYTNLFLSSLVILFTLFCSSSQSAQLSVPAEFVMRLQPPGSNNDFLRPSDIFIDDFNGEVFVADPGNNRILIFDSTGIFKFEFEGAGHFSSPKNVVVNSEGFIYVLGSKREGRFVVKFDFDGLFIEELVLPVLIDELKTDFSFLTIDKIGNLYLYDSKGLQICKFDENGTLLTRFNVLPLEESELRNEGIVYSFKVVDDKIYVPISDLGFINVYDLDGNLIRGLGIKGNNPGQLNFPVAVQVHNNLIMVLDKHRINVVCYSLEGKFLGEFGGKGSSPGWFYHPTFLEVNNQNQVYVGQIFENKIQLCQIPEFILEKAEPQQSQTNGEEDVL